MSSEPAHRCELYEGPDRMGRYHYALFWVADYHPGHPDGEHGSRERAQHFFGRPPDDIEQVDFRHQRQAS